jgi:hypothetical protein
MGLGVERELDGLLGKKERKAHTHTRKNNKETEAGAQ